MKRLVFWHHPGVRERLTMWIAWHLPRSVVFWAYIRLASATTRDGEVASQQTYTALHRWYYGEVRG